MEENIKDVSVAQRQIHILSLLSSNPQGFTVLEIVDKLKRWDIDVSKRTVSRDIDELSLSYGITEDEVEGKTYFKADRYNLSNVDLSVTDMISLAFIKELLSPYKDTDIGENAISIVDKITGSMANINKLHLEEIKQVVQIVDVKKDKNSDVNKDIEKSIRNAIDKNVKIDMTYKSFNKNEITSRLVRPYAIVFNDGYMCVEGYCELRKDIRSFRVSRISNVELTTENFKIPEDYLTNRRDNQFIHLSSSEKEKVVIKFVGEKARYVKEYDSYLADSITDSEDGIIFTTQTAINDELIKWILGYGKSAIVMEPEQLVHRLEKEIKNMINNY